MKKTLAQFLTRDENQPPETKLTRRRDLGDSAHSVFDYLTEEEQSFVISFLKYQGNFKALQKELNLPYSAAKKKLGYILTKLGVKEDVSFSAEVVTLPEITLLPIEPEDSKVTRAIKNSLNAQGGKAIITLFRGDPCEIWYDVNGKGLVSPKIPLRNHLTWEVFDAAVEIVIKNGGSAKKGSAQSGARLGSEKLPLDSVEGYIAHKVHGVLEGESAFGPAFVICAILDWAGVCHNTRGYLTLKSTFTRD